MESIYFGSKLAQWLTRIGILPTPPLPSRMEFLTDIREKLSEREQWTDNQFARDSLGLSVRCYDERAVSWCLIGAGVRYLVVENGQNPARVPMKPFDTLHKIADARGYPSLAHLNDFGGYDEVIEVLDEAIELETVSRA